MSLEVLGVKIGLVAVWTGEFAIGILCRHRGGLAVAGSIRRGGGPARCAGEDTTTSLRADDVGRLRIEIGHVERLRLGVRGFIRGR